MPVLYRRGLLESTRVTMIAPEYISPNPDQPRRYFDPDGLSELADSIRAHGILQPLSVRRKGGGRYELIAGERRLRAAMICGLEQVPCLVLEVSRESSCLLSLIENLQRRDLDFWEEAKALERLTTVYGLSQEEAAAKVGKSQSAVANKLAAPPAPGRAVAAPEKRVYGAPRPRPAPPAHRRGPAGGRRPAGPGGLDRRPHRALRRGGLADRSAQGEEEPPSPAHPGHPLLPEFLGPQPGRDAFGGGGRQMPPGRGGRRPPAHHTDPASPTACRLKSAFESMILSLLFGRMFHVKHPVLFLRFQVFVSRETCRDLRDKACDFPWEIPCKRAIDGV